MISSETIESVSVVTLNRPERRNALGTESMRQLASALSKADRDPATGAILLTGTPPAFCAGSDLKELGGLSVDEMCEHEAATAAVARSIAFLSKPVVAAVEGYALGGGAILAISCDVVVTATNAKWHLPEVKNGWLPPWGLQALVTRVGPVKARLLTWGAEPIDGVEALRLGVADYAAEAGAVLDRSLAIARSLAALPREAVTSVKRFYEPAAAADGERLDRVASRFFAADCGSPAARATLDRFTVKS
jgi:enoyl-CoA hydratase/carnithine racemase